MERGQGVRFPENTLTTLSCGATHKCAAPLYRWIEHLINIREEIRSLI
jgi:hypothetical protein